MEPTSPGFSAALTRMANTLLPARPGTRKLPVVELMGTIG